MEPRSSAMAGPGPVGGRDRFQEWAAIIALAVAALLLRLYLLRFYDIVSADGTGYVGAARALASGEISPLTRYGFYPVIIWLVSLTGLDLELAGRLVSMVFGSLLVVPLYLLGREFFSRQTALAACLVTAFWPTLLHWSCEVMSQATYTFLVFTGFFCVWRMSRTPSVGFGIAAGLSLGLAYLTRTEASLLFLVMPLATLVVRKPGVRRRWPALVAYGGVFALLLGVNLLLIHHVTGAWQLAAKTSTALNDALSGYLKIPDLSHLPEFKSTGYLSVLRDYPGFVGTNTLNNLIVLGKTFVPLPLLLFALVGFISGGWRSERNVIRLFLAASFSPLLVIIIFYYIGPEYTQPYLPVLLLWAGEGARLSERFLAARLAGAGNRWVDYVNSYAPFTLAAALIVAATLMIRQLPADNSAGPYRPSDDGGRRDERNIGLLLKRYLPPGKIMTRWGRIAYYSERDSVNIPQADFAGIMAVAKENGVRFLVVDGKLFGVRPQLEELLDPLAEDESRQTFYLSNDPRPVAKDRIRLSLLYLDPSSLGVVVYEIGQ